MNYFLNKDVVMLFLFSCSLLWGCGKLKKNGHEITESVNRITLTLDWYALADAEGKLNNEMGEAAAEIAVFSNDGSLVASGSRLSYDVKVWNLYNKEIFTYKCDSSLEVVSFSPNDEYLLAGGEFNQLLIWKVDDWKLSKEIQLSSGIESLRFSNDGEILAIGRYDGIVELYHTSDFSFIDSLKHGTAERKKGIDFRDDVNSIDFSADDNYLLSGGFDGHLKIWFLPELKLIKDIHAHDGSIKSVRINKNGNCIATASTAEDYIGDNSIKLWDFKSGDLLHKLSFPMGMESVEFSPNGNYLIGGGRESRTDNENAEPKGHIYFYSIPENLLALPIRQIHKEQVFNVEHLCFNEDGSKLLSSHQDGTVRLWNLNFEY